MPAKKVAKPKAKAKTLRKSTKLRR